MGFILQQKKGFNMNIDNIKDLIVEGNLGRSSKHAFSLIDDEIVITSSLLTDIGVDDIKIPRQAYLENVGSAEVSRSLMRGAFKKAGVDIETVHKSSSVSGLAKRLYNTLSSI